MLRIPSSTSFSYSHSTAQSNSSIMSNIFAIFKLNFHLYWRNFLQLRFLQIIWHRFVCVCVCEWAAATCLNVVCCCFVSFAHNIRFLCHGIAEWLVVYLFAYLCVCFWSFLCVLICLWFVIANRLSFFFLDFCFVIFQFLWIVLSFISYVCCAAQLNLVVKSWREKKINDIVKSC